MQPGAAQMPTGLSSSEGQRALPRSIQQLPRTDSAAWLLRRSALAAGSTVRQQHVEPERDTFHPRCLARGELHPQRVQLERQPTGCEVVTCTVSHQLLFQEVLLATSSFLPLLLFFTFTNGFHAVSHLFLFIYVLAVVSLVKTAMVGRPLQLLCTCIKQDLHLGQSYLSFLSSEDHIPFFQQRVEIKYLDHF